MAPMCTRWCHSCANEQDIPICHAFAMNPTLPSLHILHGYQFQCKVAVAEFYLVYLTLYMVLKENMKDWCIFMDVGNIIWYLTNYGQNAYYWTFWVFSHKWKSKNDMKPVSMGHQDLRVSATKNLKIERFYFKIKIKIVSKIKKLIFKIWNFIFRFSAAYRDTLDPHISKSHQDRLVYF